MSMSFKRILIIPIKQKPEFNELLRAYSQAFRLAYFGYDYHTIRKELPEYNSQIVANAIYDARGLRKSVLATHSYPKKPLTRNYVFLRKQDINGESIIFKPRNRIYFKRYPSERQISIMQENKVKGAKLVKREDGKFMLHVVIEKDIRLPRWEECETIIGVDIGMNYLAVCSALLPNGKFTNPLFFKGGLWRHLCDRKRKISPYRTKEWRHITNRQNEILHTISKRIVEYAKQFLKPIIVLEKLGRFKNGTWNKRWNFLLSNWSRRKLQNMIEYKAKWEGFPVVYVYPRKRLRYAIIVDQKESEKEFGLSVQSVGEYIMLIPMHL
jgi:IS605 OrfB family transposase